MARLRGLRWRLARLIAPIPIMADPFPGDGSFIVTREGGLIASFRAATLDVSIETTFTVRDVAPTDYGPDWVRRYGTFSGTLVR